MQRLLQPPPFAPVGFALKVTTSFAVKDMPMIRAACLLAASFALTACGAHKVVTMPAKAAYKTAEVGVKGVYYTGKGTYYTGKYAGKGVYYTGKGVYQVGKTSVDVYDGVMDRAEQLVRITAMVVNIAGDVVEITDVVAIQNIEQYLEDLTDIGDVLEVAIEEIGDVAVELLEDEVEEAANHKAEEVVENLGETIGEQLEDSLRDSAADQVQTRAAGAP